MLNKYVLCTAQIAAESMRDRPLDSRADDDAFDWHLDTR